MLPAELSRCGAELPVSKPLPLQPRGHDGHLLHPPQQEATLASTQLQRALGCSDASPGAPTHTSTRLAGAEHHTYPAPHHQVRSEDMRQRSTLNARFLVWNEPFTGSQRCFCIVSSFVQSFLRYLWRSLLIHLADGFTSKGT